MATLSLVGGNHVSRRGFEDHTMETTNQCIGKDYPAHHFLGSLSKREYFWPKTLADLKSTKGNKFNVVAKIRKGRKHDYPWPNNMDPNISSGFLTYLSHFKPLTEKPKPVTLDFEKPLVDLEKKILEVRTMADDTGLDFSDQIGVLERKYQQALKDLYTHLTPIQRLSIARHPNRPTVLDHILNITEKWVELHGDRAGYNDPAIVTGIGSMDGKSYMFIGHQKGRNTKENITRNFAMPTPHGYRKALRMMKYADHHKFPIITFVDTPGAFADLKSEELGQGEAIAQNLRTMFGFQVPIISIVTGEGGSGGALAIACANKLFMLENSAFYVASPEACAAILWKSSKAAPKAAEKLRITAQEHYKRGIADGIIPEPLGGAHVDPAWTSQQIKSAITQSMEELTKMDAKEVQRHRMLKFRSIGKFQELEVMEPERKRNMKPPDVNTSGITDIESELQNLKKTIFETRGPFDPTTEETIEKIEQEVDQEMTNVLSEMGLEEKIQSLRLELSKVSSRSLNQPLDRNLNEKVDKIMQEFKNKLSRPGAYMGLKQKLQKLEAVNRLIDMKVKQEKLKAEINQKVSSDIKENIENLKNAQEKLSNGNSLNKELVMEAENAKKELEEVLRSANFEVVKVVKRRENNPPPDIEQKMINMNNEIFSEIDKVVNSKGLKEKIKELEDELAKGSSLNDVENIEAGIRESILSSLNITDLKEKIDSLKMEVESKSEVSECKVGAENGRH